jgi:hypothetical protein
MLGEAAPVTRHRRARVVYGADQSPGDRSYSGRHSGIPSGSLYDRTAGVLAEETDEFGGAEGE